MAHTGAVDKARQALRHSLPLVVFVLLAFGQCYKVKWPYDLADYYREKEGTSRKQQFCPATSGDKSLKLPAAQVRLLRGQHNRLKHVDMQGQRGHCHRS